MNKNIDDNFDQLVMLEFAKSYINLPKKNNNKADLTFTDKDGKTTLVEIKTAKPEPIDFLNLASYKETGKTLIENRIGILTFNELSSELLFLEDNTNVILKRRIRKNNLQWLMCRELFAIAPNPCSLAELSNALEAEHYFNKDKPDEEKEYKIFLNARKRLNELTILYLRINDAIYYSGRDYAVNETFVAK